MVLPGAPARDVAFIVPYTKMVGEWCLVGGLDTRQNVGPLPRPPPSPPFTPSHATPLYITLTS